MESFVKNIFQKNHGRLKLVQGFSPPLMNSRPIETYTTEKYIGREAATRSAL